MNDEKWIEAPVYNAMIIILFRLYAVVCWRNGDGILLFCSILGIMRVWENVWLMIRYPKKIWFWCETGTFG